MEIIGMSMGIFGTIFVTTGDAILKSITMCIRLFKENNPKHWDGV